MVVSVRFVLMTTTRTTKMKMKTVLPEVAEEVEAVVAKKNDLVLETSARTCPISSFAAVGETNRLFHPRIPCLLSCSFGDVV